MKEITLQAVILKLGKLEIEKAKKVEEILLHSRKNNLFSEEIRNSLLLDLVDQLRSIQDQIDDIQLMTVQAPKDMPIK